MAESYRDRALVVRTYDFGEADRIVVLLTREHGVVRSVAKGVRRARSRFGSRLQPFVVIDALLYQGRNLATIAQADTVEFLATGIIEDYDRYCAASAVVEVAQSLQLPDDPALFDAATSALRALRTTTFPVTLLDAYVLSIMELAGIAPQLFNCASCGAPGPHHAFHPAIGGAACLHCRPPGSTEVDEDVLHLMWLLSKAQWEKVEELLHGDNGNYLAAAAHKLVSDHLRYHLGSRIASLEVLKQTL